MANTRKANVIRVDTSAAFTDVRRILGIKYVGATSGTAKVRADALNTGEILWEHDGDVLAFEDVCIKETQGVYIEVTNSAVVYLYLK